MGKQPSTSEQPVAFLPERLPGYLTDPVTAWISLTTVVVAIPENSVGHKALLVVLSLKR